MKKIIEVREFTPPPGKEYLAEQYPGPGIYKTMQGWMIVYNPSGAATLVVITLGSGYAPPIPMEDYIEPKLEQAAGGITAADLLKAIAITQKPEMAKELLR